MWEVRRWTHCESVVREGRDSVQCCVCEWLQAKHCVLPVRLRGLKCVGHTRVGVERVCVHACVHACVCACMCVRACVCVCDV